MAAPIQRCTADQLEAVCLQGKQEARKVLCSLCGALQGQEEEPLEASSPQRCQHGRLMLIAEALLCVLALCNVAKEPLQVSQLGLAASRHGSTCRALRRTPWKPAACVTAITWLCGASRASWSGASMPSRRWMP